VNVRGFGTLTPAPGGGRKLCRLVPTWPVRPMHLWRTAKHEKRVQRAGPRERVSLWYKHPCEKPLVKNHLTDSAPLTCFELVRICFVLELPQAQSNESFNLRPQIRPASIACWS
jgi:hypothetical protein